MALRQLRKQQRCLPSGDPNDPGYRRLRYCRYADDQLLGFIGPKAEAEQIKARLARFLRDELRLELSADKTLIMHARTGAARFLGYNITVQHADRKTTRGKRSINGSIALKVPTTVIKAKTSPYLKRGKPAHRSQLVNEDDYSIVNTFGAEYRGLVNYYLLAGDVYKLSRVRWVMETALLKTLACKHDSSVSKMAARYKAKIETLDGIRTCFEARVERDGKKPLVARFGGQPLKKKRNAVLVDRKPVPGTIRRKELINRLLAGRCESCGHRGEVQVHHVRKLADLNNPGRPQHPWMATMAKRRRKTLIVCTNCHDTIHGRHPIATTQ